MRKIVIQSANKYCCCSVISKLWNFELVADCLATLNEINALLLDVRLVYFRREVVASIQTKIDTEAIALISK